MLYLHDKSYLYNDLKPSNILIDKDFGLAHKIENDDKKSKVIIYNCLSNYRFLLIEIMNH